MATICVYRQGDLNGIGYLTEFGGVPIHNIAWDDGSQDRFRDTHPHMEMISIERATVRVVTDETTKVVQGSDRDVGEAVLVSATEAPQTDETSEESTSQEWSPPEGSSEAAAIRSYLSAFGIETDSKTVIGALASKGIEVSASQVAAAKRALAKE